MTSDRRGQLHIVYFSPARAPLRAFVADLESAGYSVVWMPGAVQVQVDDQTVVFKHERTPEGVQGVLDRAYAHSVLVDLRPRGDGTSLTTRAQAGYELLETLDHREDVELRYGFHRIVALVSDHDGPEVDEMLLELGARGVRHALRASAGKPGEESFAVRVLRETCQVIQSRRIKKTALCLSGGGITGIYFELGVLKCLGDCLPTGALNRFDMMFGISAGAVVSSTLAVGYSVDEFMARLAGWEDTRMPPLNPRLVGFGNIDYASAARRSSRAMNSAARWLLDLFRRNRRRTVDDLFLDYSDLVGPPFSARGFERMLREAFEIDGATNDFRRLNTELFIGGSDQDAKKHVLFGAEPLRHVPISRAAQASVSVTPFFPAVEIEGRYYEDGAVTRTSNFIEAIRRDGTLVVIVDPFLPFVSKRPGATRDRGLFYQMDQSVRTISYTRFENARDWVLRRHPEVSVYTFLPSNRQRQLLSNNPMDHRPFLEVWRSAYLSTFNRLERLSHRLAGDLKAHGLPFDLAKAQCVAQHLERKERPDFEDFYPDRRVIVPKPTLVLRQQKAKLAPAPQVPAA